LCTPGVGAAGARPPKPPRSEPRRAKRRVLGCEAAASEVAGVRGARSRLGARPASRALGGVLRAYKNASRMSVLVSRTATCFCTIATVATSGLVACAGPWAQPTHVVLAPMSGSKVSGQADVVEATSCVHRCEPVGGSDILVIVDRPAARAEYEAILAKGSCAMPNSQQMITRFIGTNGGRAHISVPLLQLTGGSYVIILERMGEAVTSSSCGIIKPS
jgi:hypothetical protein